MGASDFPTLGYVPLCAPWPKITAVPGSERLYSSGLSARRWRCCGSHAIRLHDRLQGRGSLNDLTLTLRSSVILGTIDGWMRPARRRRATALPRDLKLCGIVSIAIPRRNAKPPGNSERCAQVRFPACAGYDPDGIRTPCGILGKIAYSAARTCIKHSTRRRSRPPIGGTANHLADVAGQGPAAALGVGKVDARVGARTVLMLQMVPLAMDLVADARSTTGTFTSVHVFQCPNRSHRADQGVVPFFRSAVTLGLIIT